ncbi:MAG TPA: outer membrane protein assembly factor BamD [bacterium]|nr:outer membrane protein assembly factor BamD [bacterium]
MRKKIFYVFSFIGLILWIAAGCSRQVVNLREMTPEDQFAYAKKIYDRGNYDKARMQFAMVAMNNPGSVISDKTQFYLADSHYHLKEYIQAIAEFERLIRSLPQSPYVDDARYKIGMCYFRLSPGYALDQEYTYKAISQFEQFLDEHPDSELRLEVEKRIHESREKLAKKEFKTAELYRKMGYIRAAVISYENVTREFTNSSFCAEAYYRKGECLLRMGESDEAETSFETLIRRFPDSTLAGQAERRLETIRASRKSGTE